MTAVNERIAAAQMLRDQAEKIRVLEAALKPGVPQAWLWQFSDGDWHEVPFATKDECEDECAGYEGKAHPLYLAVPPAQPMSWPIDGSVAGRIAEQYCLSYETVQLIARQLMGTPPAQPDAKPGEPAPVPDWVVPRLKEMAARLQQLVGVLRDDDPMQTPLSNTALQVESVFRTLERSAPPAQTPVPRLTDEHAEYEWERVTGHSVFGGSRSDGRAMYISPDEVVEFAHAIETAVRKQLGVNDE